jgi:hypothetical protein
VAVEHPLAEPGEAWFAVVAELDQLSIQRQAAWKAGELKHVGRHLPPLAAEQAEAADGGDKAAEAVPLELIGVITRGSGPLRASIGSGRGANGGRLPPSRSGWRT